MTVVTVKLFGQFTLEVVGSSPPIMSKKSQKCSVTLGRITGTSTLH